MSTPNHLRPQPHGQHVPDPNAVAHAQIAPLRDPRDYLYSFVWDNPTDPRSEFSPRPLHHFFDFPVPVLDLVCTLHLAGVISITDVMNNSSHSPANKIRVHGPDGEVLGLLS